MTRSGVRNLTVLVLFTLALVGGLLYWQVKSIGETILAQQATLAVKQAEFNNLTALGQAQDKLDRLTIDEREATQLDILKYLGLERREDLNFSVTSRESKSVGDTELVVRTVALQTNIDYVDTMQLLDQLFGGGKLRITNIELLSKPDAKSPNQVVMNLRANLFGLQKKGELMGLVEASQ